MSFMDKMQAGLEKFMGPFAQKITENKIMSALTSGMMMTIPLSLGVATFAILGNLPFEPWQNFLLSTGLGKNMLDIVAATTSLMAIYIVPAIAYHYAKNEGENGITSAILALAAFISLQPQTITAGKDTISGLLSSNLGSQGIFVGMITASLISFSYSKLMKKNIKLNLPDSVPPNVSESLSPTFVAMIIFLGIFVVRYLTGLTPYGDVFNLVNTIIGQPVMHLGATPWAFILFTCFGTLCWFFGIHPAAIMNIYLPVFLTANIANIEAYLAGTPSSELPYLALAIVAGFGAIGGQGNTLSLVMVMLASAKSERYKALSKLAFIPNIFNINEPVIFGVPVMLNPYFLIPIMVTTFFGTGFGYFAVSFLGIGNAFNPTIMLPWVMPGFVGNFITGGWRLGLAIIFALVVQMLIWYPFFKMADKQAFKEESEVTEVAEAAYVA